MDFLHSLSDQILKKTDQSVQFTNGCWLSLVDDGGICFASTPYGQECAFATSRLNEIIPSWIAYWSESRDETGKLIEKTAS